MTTVTPVAYWPSARRRSRASNARRSSASCRAEERGGLVGVEPPRGEQPRVVEAGGDPLRDRRVPGRGVDDRPLVRAAPAAARSWSTRWPTAPSRARSCRRSAASRPRRTPLVRGDRLEVERRRLGRVVRALAGERVVEHHDVGHPEHGRAAGQRADRTAYDGGDPAAAAPSARRPASRRRAGPPPRGSARPSSVAAAAPGAPPGCVTSSQRVERPAGHALDDDDVAGPVDGQRRAGEALADALDASGSAAPGPAGSGATPRR